VPTPQPRCREITCPPGDASVNPLRDFQQPNRLLQLAAYRATSIEAPPPYYGDWGTKQIAPASPFLRQSLPCPSFSPSARQPHYWDKLCCHLHHFPDGAASPGRARRAFAAVVGALLLLADLTVTATARGSWSGLSLLPPVPATSPGLASCDTSGWPRSSCSSGWAELRSKHNGNLAVVLSVPTVLVSWF
jgi:hypothetical protein